MCIRDRHGAARRRAPPSGVAAGAVRLRLQLCALRSVRYVIHESAFIFSHFSGVQHFIENAWIFSISSLMMSFTARCRSSSGIPSNLALTTRHSNLAPQPLLVLWRAVRARVRDRRRGQWRRRGNSLGELDVQRLKV